MQTSATGETHRGGDELTLAGVVVCLVFEHSLSHYTRLLQEIDALRGAHAEVELLTSWTECGAPFDRSRRTVAPLDPAVAVSIVASGASWRPLRLADNVVRNATRFMLRILLRGSARRSRSKALRRVAERANVFWVIDYPSLPLVLRAARAAKRTVVYETVDLVPEYPYRGERARRRAIDGERRALREVDGFITACESYADYYVETYGDVTLTRRAVVRDNMPSRIMPRAEPSHSPLRLLFLGSLMFDRPVAELIEAMACVGGGATLTFQGKNYLGESPSHLIARLGLGTRVTVLPPCPPDEVVERASAYDIGIVALRGDGENERRASTSKLFTYMAAGLAVLGSDLPGIARIVQRHSNGVLVEGMDPADWSMAMTGLLSMPDAAINSMKRRSLDAARLYAWEKQRPAFLAEFVRALERGGWERARGQ